MESEPPARKSSEAGMPRVSPPRANTPPNSARKRLVAQDALGRKTGPERNQIAAPRKHGIVDIAPFPGPAWNQRAACLRRASALLEAVVVIQERIDMVVILECAGALCAGLQAPRISIRGARALV